MGREGRGGHFGKGKRDGLASNATPGPGAYDGDFRKLKRKLGGAGRFGKAGNISSTNDIPGPGQYDLNIGGLHGKKGRGVVIGKQKRDGLGSGDTPGPGTYNSGNMDGLANGKSGNGLKFNKASRLDRANDMPGPGQYDLNIGGLHN